MDFDLPEELAALREIGPKLAREKVQPRAREIDETGEYPDDVFAVFRDAGLLGLCLPVEYGGSGAGILGLTIAVEEVAKYSSTCALMLLLTRLATGPIIIAGSEEQKQRYLPGIAAGVAAGRASLCPRPDAGQRRRRHADPGHARSRPRGRLGAERREVLDIRCRPGRLVHGVRQDR